MTETPRADALLTALISGDPQIEAFGDLTDEHEREKALHVLLALLTDPNLILRIRATQALGSLGDRQAVEPLLSSLAADENSPDIEWDLMDARVEALVAIGDPKAILPLLAHTDINGGDLFDKLLEFDKDDLVRILGEVALNPADPLRELAFNRLGLVDDPRSIKLLIEMLSDPLPQIRQGSVMSLGLLRATEAVPFLLPYAADPIGEVRAHTAITLGELGSKQAIPALLLLLNDKEQGLEIRMHAANALGKLGDPSGLDLIHDYIAVGYKSYQWKYLHHVLEAVKTLSAPVGPRFIRMLNRLPAPHFSNDFIQRLIVEILAEQPDPEALPVLKRMLESDNEAVRQAAQQAIRHITGN